MLFHILKKDIKRKKTMNVIFLVFILLATMFIASSVNNVMAITSALDDYFEHADVPDHILCLSQEEEAKRAEDFADQEALSYWKQVNWQAQNDAIRINGNDLIYSNTILVSQVQKGIPQYDDADQVIEQVEPGMIYITAEIMHSFDLSIGDKITLDNGAVGKDLMVAGEMKDPLFGSSMIGMTRFLVSDEDFHALSDQALDHIYNIGMYTQDDLTLSQSLAQQEFQMVMDIPRSTMKIAYIMDMVIAGILLVVSACLILFSMLILRFTIQFTMSEEYREIGVMKAIGIRNASMRRLYLFKYFIIALIGGTIGFGLSLPFGQLLMEQVSQNIILSQTNYLWINVLCALGVIGCTVLFGYLCTRSIAKITVIDAIRHGEKGERFHKKSFLRLSTFLGKPPIFMACNDILSSFKRYMMLILIFTLGMLLVIVPINALNTISSDHMLPMFSMAPSDYVLSKNQVLNGTVDEAEIKEQLDDMRVTLAEQEVSAKVFTELVYRMNITHDDKKTASLAFQGIGDVTCADYQYLEGSAPRTVDEVAISHVIAKRIDAGIGDLVSINLGDTSKTYMVTAIFQTMNNLGEGIRFYEGEQLQAVPAVGSWGIQIAFLSSDQPEEIPSISKLQAWFPAYEIATPGDYINDMIGDVGSQFAGIKQLILLIVLGINILVSVLMVKSFIAKEKGEIAMLKAIGFRNTTLMLWQILRIALILVMAICLALLCNDFVTGFSVGKVFEFMGAAQVSYAIDPFEIYFLYPLIVLVVTLGASWLATLSIKQITTQDTNALDS